MTTIKLLYSGFFKGEDFHKLLAIRDNFVLEMFTKEHLFWQFVNFFLLQKEKIPPQNNPYLIVLLESIISKQAE